MTAVAEEQEWIARVKEKLGATRALADNDRPSPNGPLELDALGRIESAMKVRLPEDYRAFLLRVGNGGVGPDYGVVPLAIENGAGIAGTPAPDPGRPFLLIERFEVVDERGERRRFPIPAGASVHDGCVALTDIGCGYFTFLVVTGERRGEVWVDQTAAMESGFIAPVAPSFRAWFERWVDASLRVSIGQHVHAALMSGARAAGHEVIARYAELVRSGGDDALAAAAQIEMELYLGERDRALASLDAAEQRLPGHPALAMVRRLALREDFRAAEGADTGAIARAAGHAHADVRLAVARNAHAPAAVLGLLARDASAAVRTAVARHASTTRGTLEDLLGSALARWREGPSEALLFELEAALRHARSPRAPALGPVLDDDALRAHPLGPWLLRTAALHHAVDPGAVGVHEMALVRHAAAAHPRLAVDDVARLAADPHPLVRLTIAVRPYLPRAALEALAVDSDEMVRSKVARHPATPPDVLARLSGDGTPDVVYALARAPHLPEHVREVLALHPSYSAPVAQEPTVPFRAWPRGARHFVELDGTSADVRARGLFSHPAYPLALLPELVEQQYGMGGFEMAFHPLLFDAPALAVRLATHPYAYTRRNIAARPDLPAMLRRALGCDPDAMVRSAIARRGDVDAELYDALSHDDDDDVRTSAAASPLLTPALAARLALDPNKWVRGAVLRNPKTPAAIADELMRDREPAVRMGAVQRPLAPLALDRLEHDEDADVRRWATWRRRASALFDAAPR